MVLVKLIFNNLEMSKWTIVLLLISVGFGLKINSRFWDLRELKAHFPFEESGKHVLNKDTDEGESSESEEDMDIPGIGIKLDNFVTLDGNATGPIQKYQQANKTCNVSVQNGKPVWKCNEYWEECRKTCPESSQTCHLVCTKKVPNPNLVVTQTDVQDGPVNNQIQNQDFIQTKSTHRLHLTISPNFDQYSL